MKDTKIIKIIQIEFIKIITRLQNPLIQFLYNVGTGWLETDSLVYIISYS